MFFHDVWAGLTGSRLLPGRTVAIFIHARIYNDEQDKYVEYKPFGATERIRKQGEPPGSRQHVCQVSAHKN